MKFPLHIRLTALFAISLMLLGQGCTKGPDAATVAALAPETLEIWGVVDDADAYGPLLQAYQAAHPHITLKYRRFRLEEYESTLLNAMAEDRGPDIFLIHNTWVGKYLPKISPMPAYTKMVYKYVSGGYTNRTETTELKNEKSITLVDLKNNYPDAVAKDVIRRVNTAAKDAAPVYEDKIVALPLSVDTLAMYVNKDMLNTANIPTIPDSWSKVQATIPRLVTVDTDGKILQAGIAMGTSNNIDRSADILSVLMMQDGTQMTTDDGYPSFSLMPNALAAGRTETPAVEALRFYTDFANPAKNTYSWNSSLPNALDMFVQGRLAYYLGYSYDLSIIKARAPKLNLAIAKLPQIDGNPVVNYANYWVWTVSKKSKYSETAWNFINYMVKPENQKKFIDLARRPPANKSLIEGQLEDEELGVFAHQILTSKSWYRGVDPASAESAIKALITQSSSTPAEQWQQLIKLTQDKVAQTMSQK